MASRALLVLVLLGVVTVHQAEARCARKSQRVNIDNCNGKLCILRKGTSTGITIRFQPDKPYRSLKAKVTGVLGRRRGSRLPGIRVPFPGVAEDACGALQQGACPVQPGEEYVYRAQIPVSQTYPSIRADVEYLLVDGDTGENVACSLFGVQIR